jgi:hypothetical protein
LNSIRWEIQRESLEDYEYLQLITAKTAEVQGRLGEAAAWVDPRRRALELCRRVVPAIAEVEKDPARILATRAAIAEEIIAQDQPPLALVQTEPPAGATLINGPIVVEVRGVCEPGTTVKINGRSVEPSADGSFGATAYPAGEAGEIAVEVEREGKKKVTVRRFQVRK